MATKNGGKPDLKRYLDKKLNIKLSGGKLVTGTMRGFDQYMNITLEDCMEVSNAQEKVNMGTVVLGNSVEMLECLDPLK